MKNKIISVSMIAWMVSGALATAGVVMAADAPSVPGIATQAPNGQADKTQPREAHRRLKAQWKQVRSDKARLRNDIKANGKDSDQVRQDREKLIQDRAQAKVLKADLKADKKLNPSG